MLLLCLTSVFAQEDSILKERLRKAKFEVYSNPTEVIRLGDSLYDEHNVTLENKIEALLMVSDAYISIRNYPLAIEFITKAKGLLSKDSRPTVQLQILSRFAYQHFQLGFYDESIRLLDEIELLNTGLNESESLDNIGYINTVRGLVYKEIVGCEVAMRYFRKAIESYLLSQNKLTKMNLSTLHYNIGNCQLNLGDYDLAQNSFNEAFAVAEKYSYNNSSLMLYAQKGIANVYAYKLDHEKAVLKLLDLYDSAKRIGDQSLLRSVLYDLSSSYLELEDWDSFSRFSSEYIQYNERILNAEKQAATYALTDAENSYNIKIAKKKVNFLIYITLVLSLLLVFTIGLFLLIHFKNKSIAIKKEEMLTNL